MSNVARDTLYGEVWAEPMTTVAARYGVSSSYLARVCDRLNVPRPARGHWAKLAAGKPSPQKPLPEAQPGDELEWSRENGSPALYRLPRQSSRERRPRRQRRERATQHHLIADTDRHFAKVRETREGYLRPYKRLLVDVYVTRPMVERALSVANTLFLEFEKLGYPVKLGPRDELLNVSAVDEREQGERNRHSPYSQRWRPDRPTVVYIDGIGFGLTLFELSESVEVRYINGKYIPVKDLTARQVERSRQRLSWTTHEDRPTGRLCLQAYSPYPNTEWVAQWREKKSGELESKAAAIIQALKTDTGTITSLIEDAKEKAEAQRREWEERWRKWEEQRTAQQRQKAHDDSVAELLSIISTWDEANRQEEFFTQAEQRATEMDDPDRSRVQDRIRLARELTGTADPLTLLQQWKSPTERYPG